jgi:hypothetical protein
MNKMFSVFLLLPLLGCETNPANFNSIVEAQLKLKSIPTIVMTCPAGNCTLTYKDPRDNDGLALPTNGWDALKSVSRDVKDITLGAAPWVATARIATVGIKRAGGNDSSVDNSINNSNNDSSADNSIKESNNDASADNSIKDSNNDASADNSINDSNNDASTDNSQQNTDRHDTYWTTIP